MSTVTFYTHIAEPESFVFRLCQRALSAGSRVLLWAEGEEEAREWDKRLWQQPPEGFLPHEIWQGGSPPADVPVLIGSGRLPESDSGRVILNLSQQLWPDNGQTVRILEIIGADEAGLAAARSRFADYRRQGFTVEHHNMHNKA